MKYPAAARETYLWGMLFLFCLFFSTCPVKAETKKCQESRSSSVCDPAKNHPPPEVSVHYGINLITQHLFPFRSPYEGPNSLFSESNTQTTNFDWLSLRFHPFSNLKFQVDYQSGRGLGVGNPDSTGLAGYVNGDAIRISSIGTAPYFARYFLQWKQPLTPDSNVTVDFGKLAVTDIFDTNRYADNPNTQFLNWGLINNLAYDYAADTQGYSKGIALQWVHPNWILKMGSFEEPVSANSPFLSNDLANNHGDQIELDKMFGNLSNPIVVRFLAYENHAHMGNYQKSLEIAALTHTVPNIHDSEIVGAVKYGFGLNFEIPLANHGNTGIFGRWGWNNDQTESFAYTEAGQTFSLGGQISGANWGLPRDYIGIGTVESELSYYHREYLAEGGLGFQLGDGALDYAPEKILEIYYDHQFTKSLSLSPDFQWIEDPGYNAARGPVSVIGIRLDFRGG